MSYYKISRDEPVAVYGGGQIGLELVRRLISSGYNVKAILDRNPSGVFNSPVPVMAASDYYQNFGSSFVYVSLGDGTQHIRTAQNLYANGFEKILFLPLYLRSKAAKDMVQSWNAFFGGDFSVRMPPYDLLWKVCAADFVLYEDQAGFVVSIVHKDYVRFPTGSCEENPFSIYLTTPDKRPFAWDKPIDNSEAIEDFKKYGLRRNSERSNFLENVLFYSQEAALLCASPAVLNKKGYFNIFDGCHRCNYMVTKGFTGLPLRILKSEWETFFREQKAQALMDFCKKESSLPFAVKHPAFIMLPVAEREADDKFIELYKELSHI